MSIQPLTDKIAISISAFCAVHCIVMPLVIVLLPTLAGAFFSGEQFHQILILLIVPISLIALTLGCRKHARISVAAWGGAGMLLLVSAAFFAHDLIGETGEQLLTLLGASVIAYGHWLNYRLCRQLDCQCGSTK